jgi:glycosyltransferase 2 family protein
VAHEQPALSAPSITARIGRYLLVLLLLGLAVHVIVPQLAGLDHTLQVLRQMVPWAVVSAVVAQVFSYLGSGYLLKSIVAMDGQRLSVGRGTLIYTAAASVGLAGGGPLGTVASAYHWMRESGVSAEGAALASWLPSFFYDSALVFAGMFGLLHLLVAHDLSALQFAGFGFTLLVLGLIVGVTLWGVRHRARLTGLATWVADRWAALRHRPANPDAARTATDRVFSAWDALRRGGWRRPALGALYNTVFDMLTLYFLFYAAGHHVSPGVLLAGYGLPLLLAKVSFLPGGIGIVEATMAALYRSLGVPADVMVVVVLTYRFLSLWLPLLLGFPASFFLQHTSGGAAHAV